MSTYKALNKQVYQSDEFSIVPIRMEDRYDIMQWRNDQIYHLRQAEPLTEAKQDAYFENVVKKLFDQNQPHQILVSFLKAEKCIGYGGLVHINWIDKNAEISFIMKTELEALDFQKNWHLFLGLIEQAAFGDLKLHKIFTYAFDLRPYLYAALERSGFKREAILPEHCLFQGKYLNVVIHSKINRIIVLREASIEDAQITFKWANDAKVRRYALTQHEISESEHLKWFESKINSSDCIYYIVSYNQVSVGSFRIDINSDSIGVISYLLDPMYHGKNLGKSLLRDGVEKARAHKTLDKIVGYVKEENQPSLNLFRKLGFTEKLERKGLLKFELNVK
jgi:RimJ/RimL family protein N-acetyltransferase